MSRSCSHRFQCVPAQPRLARTIGLLPEGAAEFVAERLVYPELIGWRAAGAPVRRAACHSSSLRWRGDLATPTKYRTELEAPARGARRASEPDGPYPDRDDKEQSK
jgi:hypothetical protein